MAPRVTERAAEAPGAPPANPIAADLEAAAASWRAGGDRSSLRLALLRILAQLAGVVLVASLVAGCSTGQLHAVNHAGASLAVATLACDWGQTRSAASERWSGGRYEGGIPARQVIGATPGPHAVDAYFAGAAIAVLGVAQFLPERWRPALYGAVVAGELVAIRGNLETTRGTCGL